MSDVGAASSRMRQAPPGFRRMGQTSRLGEYLAEVWQRRQFAIVVPIGELRAQNMDTVLGNLWHLLNPLLLIAVYYFVFGVLLDANRGVDNYISFLTIGVLIYGYTQKSVVFAAKSVASNEGLIRSIYFPRALLPLSAIIGQTVAFLPATAVMLAVALVSGEPLRLRWIALVPIAAMQGLFNLGTGFVAARVTDSFRDLENVLPFCFRLAFYGSAILFPAYEYLGQPVLGLVFLLNPLFAFVSAARWAVMDMPFPPSLLASAVIWTVGLLIAGFAFFRAAEQRYGRG